jgi:hypothetical protein
VHACIHRDECSYVYEYLCLYYVSKKRSYFSNLMSTGLSYSMGYGADDGQASQNASELDDTQTHDAPIVQKDGLAAGKEKKRSRNFSVDEDKLLVSGWLNISIDPIHGTEQALGTYWARIHKYFHEQEV